MGPRTATQLVATIRVDDFDGRDKIASYCGLAPATHESSRLIDCDKPSRASNKLFRSLLIFSCNPLRRSKSRHGEYLKACLAGAWGTRKR
ncbi:transposase [Eggerthella guodeyinii]|uniref:Transposase n=1 Tax=Eggerthella guodeyinii TaxID=2690837 RepID=A0A6N7RMF8_9ACTN|nr:transposase [Eggerthella guodeyinii]